MFFHMFNSLNRIEYKNSFVVFCLLETMKVIIFYPLKKVHFLKPIRTESVASNRLRPDYDIESSELGIYSVKHCNVL